MWNQLSPQQQQQYLMALLGHQGGAAGQGMPIGQPGMPSGGAAAQLMSAYNPALAQPNAGQTALMSAFNPQLGQQSGAGLANPLMTGGNSAVNPQQQAQMMQYLQTLQSPQGFGATANSNVPLWALLMGRSPMYGTGGAVT